MSNINNTEVWKPCDDLKSAKKKYGVIVLNTPIKIACNPLLIENLWNKGMYVEINLISFPVFYILSVQKFFVIYNFV